MPQDLTVGSPSKTLLKFSLPLLLSTALQQIYSIADSVIVGRYTGTAGLAAIGAGYPITLIFVAIATGGSMGCSVVISRLFGAKELGRTRTAAETALLALSLLGVVLAALGVVLAGPILRLMNAHGELWLDASVYLRIYAVGVLPMLVYNAANAVFTGLGDSRRPLYFLMLSSALNIVLDIYAVASLGLGVAGAAVGFSVVTAELTFENAVGALHLLLFTQLRAVVGETLTGNLAVLAGLAFCILDLGVKGTACALQIEVGTLAARELQLGTEISCHFFMLPLLSCGVDRIQFAFDEESANAGYENL